MENLWHRNGGMLSDVFEGSNLAIQKTSSEVLDACTS